MMLFLRRLAAFSATFSIAEATWANNLNYASPSINHPGLGIAIHKVVRRNNPDRGQSFTAAQLNFTHGVASGDPAPDSVILWTRISPAYDDDKSNITVSGYVPLYNHETAEYVKASKNPVCVNWKIAEDRAFSNVVNSGTAYTSSDIDYTVKVEANQLEPYTQYFYQFAVCNSDKSSVVGRTKTTPAPNQKLPNGVGLAVYSCSNYPFGYFNAIGNAARRDNVDWMIHLGDYIYEYKNGDYGWGQSIDRIPMPDRTIYTLYDYRRRLANYREDLDLLLSHQQFAWITVWDDHEVSDNGYRDGASALNNTENSFVMDGGVSVDQRKMNAVRAYFEWMPIRQVDMDDDLRIWRSFAIGNLFDLLMLDTRNYDRSITDLYWNTEYVHQISDDASRSMMGSSQENWFYNSLRQSADRGAAWRVIGSQTVFSRVNESVVYGNLDPLDYDAWDGYQANRNRTLNTLSSNNIGNNIVLAGDSHASWVTDLVWLDHADYDPETGTGALGVEFAGSAVSSPCPYGQNISLDAANSYSHWLTANNQELQWQDLYYRGYYELHIDYDRVDATYYGMPSIVTRNSAEIPLANFTVISGQNRLERPVAGGVTESGSLKYGIVRNTNLTNDTSVPGGRWFVSRAEQEDL